MEEAGITVIIIIATLGIAVNLFKVRKKS